MLKLSVKILKKVPGVAKKAKFSKNTDKKTGRGDTITRYL